jgi:hypothetical protein
MQVRPGQILFEFDRVPRNIAVLAMEAIQVGGWVVEAIIMIAGRQAKCGIKFGRGVAGSIYIWDGNA